MPILQEIDECGPLGQRLLQFLGGSVALLSLGGKCRAGLGKLLLQIFNALAEFREVFPMVVPMFLVGRHVDQRSQLPGRLLQFRINL